MKINCTVEIINRNVQNQNNKTKKSKSVLALSKHPKTGIICIYLFNITNKNGKKYEIMDNIVQIFTKFVNDGKSTIRFKQPPDDLLIQADPIILKHFLQTIKLGLNNVPIKNLVTNIGVTVNKKEVAPPTKLVITRRSEYPLHGFPRTLTYLRINDINRIGFDKGILCLQQLQVLDLTNNSICAIPEAFNMLPNLSVLNLSQNKFGNCKDWRWIGRKLGKTLVELNLSSNNLKYCPINISFLENLVNLNISSNQICTLPNSICTMRNLKICNLSHNVLKYLPSGISRLQFDWIDVSNNLYVDDDDDSYTGSSQITLLGLAASSVLYNRLKYPPEMLPFTVREYLLTTMYCKCGKPIFSKRYRKVTFMYERFLRAKTVVNDSRLPTIECVFCSQECYYVTFREPQICVDEVV